MIFKRYIGLGGEPGSCFHDTACLNFLVLCCTLFSFFQELGRSLILSKKAIQIVLTFTFWL